MTDADVRLHVGRLVLHGFSPVQAQRVRDAFVAALHAPWPDAAAPAAGEHDVLRLSVRDTGTPEALGRAAARALRGSLSR